MTPEGTSKSQVLTLDEIDECVRECTMPAIAPETFQLLRLRHMRRELGKQLVLTLRDRHGIWAAHETFELMRAVEQLVAEMFHLPEFARQEADYYDGLLTKEELERLHRNRGSR